MDPLTHTFTGAALSVAGLRRVTPLATATLIIAANAPDVDVVAQSFGPYTALAFRRGWTHGPLAMVLLPFLVAGGVLLYDRLVRRRRRPPAPPARAGPLVLLAAIGVATHPFLDWLNNYGLRWLMPFDGRWFYGDALFIIDPWVWLVLGGSLFLIYSRRLAAVGAWAAFGVLATFLVLSVPIVPTGARVLWAVGLASLVARRLRTPPGRRDAAAEERIGRRAASAVGVYILALLTLTWAGRREVQEELARAGIPVHTVMVAASPANPFAASVVVVTPEAYHLGRFGWFRAPRVVLSPDPIPRREPDEVVRAAMRTQDARDYLTWARFPFFETEQTADGFVVRGPTRLRAGRVDSHGDHRLAMALAVAGCAADGDVVVAGAECVDDSFPGFHRLLAALGAGVDGPDRVDGLDGPESPEREREEVTGC
jgi:inner membrane protein